MLMNWLKKAPTGLIIAVIATGGAVTIAYIGGFVYLTAQGKDITEYSRLLNSTMNWLMILLGATTTVASVQAARSASNAEDNTNGRSDEERQAIAQAAATAAIEQLSRGGR